jgi:purine-nucleoside/S-methyl-5'-thioadenosine phosphorylase / adenosine deaminase
MSWLEERIGGVDVFRPDDAPDGVTVAFSGRGHAPEDEPAPTAFLARRFAKALGLDGTPVHWAKQVHGAAAVAAGAAPRGSAPNAGECDALATSERGVAVVVQTADCVPVLLSGSGAVGAAHAGWRGSAKGVVGSAVAALARLGAAPASLSAWIGPAIGACCYEVGGDVAAQFAGEFVRRGCGGAFQLDLKAANAAQLEAAGVPRAAIRIHPACTRCGGERFASWRRDGVGAGRMIALIARG